MWSHASANIVIIVTKLSNGKPRFTAIISAGMLILVDLRKLPAGQQLLLGSHRRKSNSDITHSCSTNSTDARPSCGQDNGELMLGEDC
jgi:hypothetical protein